MKVKLCNVRFLREDYFDSFTIDKYHFVSCCEKKESLYIPAKMKYSHKYNGYVEFSGKQEKSILFSNVRIFDWDKRRSYEMTQLDDILALGSIFTGWNWVQHSRRNHPYTPVSCKNLLLPVSSNEEIQNDIITALLIMNTASWKRQFENGFHIRMLLNNSNIYVTESRYLSLCTIWEWLYPHLRNTEGATIRDECGSLNEIFSYVLQVFWPGKVNKDIYRKGKDKKTDSVLYCLRNQLAHSGVLPINRKYAAEWIQKIMFDSNDLAVITIKRYVRFFEWLTQAVVLKTIGINIDNRKDAYGYHIKIEKFLKEGKL